MKKALAVLFSFFTFLFVALLDVSVVSAEDKTFDYETYILKYDYSLTTLNSDNWSYTNNTYVLDIPTDLDQIDYVTYFFYVRNTGTETLTYPFGTYNISNDIASTAKIRFEDEVSANGTTYFVVRNYDIDTIEEFMSSLVNISFYESMVDTINEYLGSSLEFSYISSGGATISGYDDVYGYDGLKYTYYPKGSTTTSYDVYSPNELPDMSYLYNYEFSNVSLIRLSDLYTITDLENKYSEGYAKGKEDGIAGVDITTDNQEAIDEYLNENDLYTNEEYLEYGELKHQEGYAEGKIDGIASVDITTDNQESYDRGYQDGAGSIDITIDNDTAYQNGYNTGYGIGYDNGQASIDIESIRQESYNNGFSNGQASVDITSDNEAIWNEAYQEGNDDGYLLGFEAGKDSIDLEAIKKAEYDRGYNNGYNIGFAEGEANVDITSDNDTVIDAYITINKYHTDYEFNLNYERGYSAGIDFVYNNIKNDDVVNKYVKDYIFLNKYHTNTEYVNSYDLGYRKGYSDGYNYGYDKGIVDGKEVIYKNIESDPIVQQVWKEKLMNGTTINIVNEGNEIVKVVKKYDITDNSDDDLIINIHNGQDTYKVETVEEVIPGESTSKENQTNTDYESIYKILIFVAVCLSVVIAIVVFIALVTSLFKPTKKTKIYRKAGNGYVWSN